VSEMGIRRVGTIVEGSRHPESTNHEDNIMRRTMKQCLRKIRAEHVVISLLECWRCWHPSFFSTDLRVHFVRSSRITVEGRSRTDIPYHVR